MSRNRPNDPHLASRVLSAGLAVLTFAGIAIGLRSLAPADVPELLSFMRSTVFLFGSTVAGSALVIVALCIWTAQRASESITFFSSGSKYTLVQAGIADLPDLYLHYENLFGTNIVPLEQMASWMKKCPSIAWKVVRLSDSGQRPTELVGFFDVEPLTLEGEGKMRAPAARALAINKGDIHSGFGRNPPTSYYVGSVGSPKDSPDIWRGICMVFFIKRILEMARDRTITVYARPDTDEGVYLVRDLFGMNKRHVGPDKEVIWSLEVNQDRFKVPDTYKRIARRIGIKLY